jgi:hypothetical protein
LKSTRPGWNYPSHWLACCAPARQAGFTGFKDSWAMFAEQIEGYRAARVLPPR